MQSGVAEAGQSNCRGVLGFLLSTFPSSPSLDSRFLVTRASSGLHRQPSDVLLVIVCRGEQWPIFENSHDDETYGEPSNASVRGPRAEAGRSSLSGRDCLHELAHDIIVPEALGSSHRSLCSVRWSGGFDKVDAANTLMRLPISPSNQPTPHLKTQDPSAYTYASPNPHARTHAHYPLTCAHARAKNTRTWMRRSTYGSVATRIATSCPPCTMTGACLGEVGVWR